MKKQEYENSNVSGKQFELNSFRNSSSEENSTFVMHVLMQYSNILFIITT